MSLERLAIDLGKRSFHCHGIDSDGIILSRKVSRSRLLDFIKELAPKAVAMEACASAHFWARRLLADGRRVPPINPWFVKPFVKGSKNDAADGRGNLRSGVAPDDEISARSKPPTAGFAIASSCRERVVCAEQRSSTTCEGF